MDKNQYFCRECFELCTRGKPHSCKQKAAPSPAAAEPSKTVSHVPHKTVSHVPHVQPPERGNADVARVRRWRSTNLDRWRAYHADYMRRWRQRRRDEALAKAKAI